MTKAEAVVYSSRAWEHSTSRVEDHARSADTPVNIYVRTDGAYRLCCYSYYGDSILWERDENSYKGWRYVKNVEFMYDSPENLAILNPTETCECGVECTDEGRATHVRDWGHEYRPGLSPGLANG